MSEFSLSGLLLWDFTEKYEKIDIKRLFWKGVQHAQFGNSEIHIKNGG